MTMRSLIRRLFQRIYRVPAPALICQCGTVAHPADLYCGDCGNRMKERLT